MKPAPLAFLWHMHQPMYRLRGERVCFMPWVRLHAIRSYYDMIRVLEEFSEVRVTFNLTGSLIEQLRAYEEGASDRFRETARIPAGDLDDSQRAFLFEHFFGAPVARPPDDLPRYAELNERRARARLGPKKREAWRELSTADYRDLQVLFDLSWFGFKAREDFPVLQEIARRGQGFTREDVEAVQAIEDEILRRVLPLYRDAAARGQIEISTSPYAHPILPLLIDTDAARQALPKAPLPPRWRAPADARRQVEEALGLVQGLLGTRPRGLWPSEGALSREAVELIGACGVAWAASDEEVLRASRTDPAADPRRPWILADADAGPVLVFRDHELSDRIGFSYARVDPAQAVDGFIATVLERGAAEVEGLVLVALDGENPWEHYPNAGGPFLRALYGGLAHQPAIACERISDAIQKCPERGTITELRAGSWIHADLGTWIGGPEKNRAWGLLRDIRTGLAGALDDPGVSEDARRSAWSSLRAAEGSDWFWWLDGQFKTDYRAQFDEMFRGHLRQACESIGREPPEPLGWPISWARQSEEPDSAPETGALSAPCIDGFEGDYFEWRGALRLEWGVLASSGTMQAARRPLESLRYGFSRDGRFCLRLDPDPMTGPQAFSGLGLDLAFHSEGSAFHLRLDLDGEGNLKRDLADRPGGEPASVPGSAAVRAVARKILEVSIPCEEVGLLPGRTAGLRIRLRIADGDAPLKEILLLPPVEGADPGKGTA